MGQIFIGLAIIGLGVGVLYICRLRPFPDGFRNPILKKLGCTEEIDRFMTFIVGLGFCFVGLLFLLGGLGILKIS